MVDGLKGLFRVLGAVYNGFASGFCVRVAQRTCEAKMADARRKCEPMLPIGEYFQRGRCRFMAEKPPQHQL